MVTCHKSIIFEVTALLRHAILCDILHRNMCTFQCYELHYKRLLN